MHARIRPVSRMTKYSYFKTFAAFVLCVFVLLPAAGCVKQNVAVPAPEASADQVEADATANITAEEAAKISAEEAEKEAAEVAAATAEDTAPLSPEEQKALESEPVELQFTLDSRDTKEVQMFFKYFTHNKKGRRSFERWLERSSRYLPYVRRVFAERGLPHDLVYLPFVESGYNPHARSRAGAGGMWQFMPFTGKKYGLRVGWWVDERNDPYKATHAAADYLTKLYDDFGDWYLALAAYNAGEGRVGRALKRSGCEDFFELSKKRQNRWRRGRRLYYLPRETRYYVPKLMAVIKIVQNLEELGFKKPDWDGEDTVASMDAPPATDLRALAKNVGLSWEQFKAYNPAFPEPGSHPKQNSTVYLPLDKEQAATAYLAGKVSKYHSYYSFYRVRRGDSWYRISRRYGVPIAVLKKYNNRRSNLLRPGQKLKIPGKGESKLTAAKLRKQRRSRAASARRTRALAKSRSNYSVKRGDSLWAIAKRYHVTVGTLAKANGISRRSRLRVGQMLYIPDHSSLAQRKSKAGAAKAKRTVTYRVRRGDTLYTIARRFGVTTKKLMDWNRLNSSKIFPGDNLKLYR